MTDLSVSSGLKTRSVFGLDFVDSNDTAGVAEQIVSLAQDGWSGYVVTPNVDIMIHASENPDSEFARALKNAEICTPDGQPIVWVSRLTKKPLSGRVPGATLFDHMWPIVAEAKLPVTMIASSPGVVDYFSASYDRINFERPGFVDLNDEIGLDELLTSTIKQAIDNESRIIFSGLGSPKDPVIAARLHKMWPRYSTDPAPVVLCLGASYEMYAGLRKRAPQWAQKVGLEWLFRFAQEPRRLFKRYFVKSPKFLKVVYEELRS